MRSYEDYTCCFLLSATSNHFFMALPPHPYFLSLVFIHIVLEMATLVIIYVDDILFVKEQPAPSLEE